MGGLLNASKREAPSDAGGCDSLFVEGVRYGNSAAKFWPTLIDEAREEFPGCSLIQLVASNSGELERRHLFPEIEFEQDIERLLAGDMDKLMEETLAQLEVLGPPSSVRIRLLSAREELLSRELPLDCIDAELFPYLVVWLLKWADIPDYQWNNEFLAGDIAGEDRKRRRLYRISFNLVKRHLSEGFYRQSLSVVPSVILMK